MFANNETGTLLPIAEIGEVLKIIQLSYHVDAVQAVGKLEILPEELGLIFSVLLLISFMVLKALVSSMQLLQILILIYTVEIKNRKKRAGTENLPAIIGMVAALKDDLEHIEGNFEKSSKLQETFLAEMDGSNYYLNQGKEQLPMSSTLDFQDNETTYCYFVWTLKGFLSQLVLLVPLVLFRSVMFFKAFYGEDSPRFARICSRQHFTSKYRTK